MIFILLLLMCIVRAGVIKPLTPEEQQQIRQIMRECQSDPTTRVPTDLINQVKRGIWSENPRLKQALLCFSKKSNFQTVNGDLQVDVIIQKWGQHYDTKVLGNLKKCIQQKNDAADTAYELFKCRQQVLGVGKDLI